jgi:hypothetical protein
MYVLPIGFGAFFFDSVSLLFYGASGRSRTGDLLITNQLLYQLSYAGFHCSRECIAKSGLCFKDSLCRLSVAVPLRNEGHRTNQKTVFTLKLYYQPVVRHFKRYLFPARQDLTAEMSQHQSLRAEPAGVFCDAGIIQMRL